jgi:hypothetical protein
MSRSATARRFAGAFVAGLLAACGSGEPARQSAGPDARDEKMMATPEPPAKRARMSAYDPQIIENARAMIAEGRETFRRDTFGDEAFWGDTLNLHRAIESSVSPKIALAVGLKVDSEALPDELVAKLKKNEVNLDEPATTVALLKLNAVVGVQGFFEESGRMKSIGITCALCHSTVDDSFSPGIGRRLDGWPNRDLDVGKIVSLAPNLDPFAKLLGVDVATVKKVLLSWGPGRYDARLDKDGKAFRPDGKPAGTLLPAAYGLAGVNLGTYTGTGSTTYWNAYVANTQMHGLGTFFDERFRDADRFPVAARSGSWNTHSTPDRITPKLAALHYYQLSLPAPEPPAGSFDRAAFRRGQKVFEGKAKCATCHVPPLFTEPGHNLHPAAEMGIDDFEAERSATKAYRTTPLRGLWARQKGGFYHDGRFPKLDDVIEHYNGHFKLQLTEAEKKDLVQFLLGL